MRNTHVIALFLLIFINNVSSSEQNTTVIVWDGTSDLQTDVSDSADTTNLAYEGSGEITQSMPSLWEGSTPFGDTTTQQNVPPGSAVSKMSTRDDGATTFSGPSQMSSSTRSTVTSGSAGEITTRGTTQKSTDPFYKQMTSEGVTDHEEETSQDQGTASESSTTATATSAKTDSTYSSSTEFTGDSSSTNKVTVQQGMQSVPPSASDRPVTSPSPFTSPSTSTPPVSTTASAFDQSASTTGDDVTLPQTSPSSPTSSTTTSTSTTTTTSSSTTTTTTTTTTTPTTIPTTLPPTTTTPPPTLGSRCSRSCNHIPHAHCDNTCQCDDKFYQSDQSCVSAREVTPQNINATFLNYTTAVVRWSIARPSDVRDVNVTFNGRLSVDATTDNATLYFLRPGTDYNITVTVTTQDGRTFASNTIKYTTRPDRVTGVAVSSRDKQITIRWSSLPVTPNVSYVVNINGESNSTEETEIRLKAEYDTCYNVTVQGRNRAGLGPESRVVQVATDAGVPGVVQHLEVTNVKSRTMTASWTSPPDANGTVMAYNITVKDVTTGQVKEKNLTCIDCGSPCSGQLQGSLGESPGFNTSQKRLTATFSDLQPFTYYAVDVVAVTRNHTGQAVSINLRTLEGKPREPQNVSVHAGTTDATIKWSIAGRPRGNTSYVVITRDLENHTAWETQCDKRHCRVVGLTPYWNYTSIVRAKNTKDTKLSNNISFSTEEDVPGPVTELNVTGVNNILDLRSLTITWRPPTLRERRGRIRGYTVHVQCQGKLSSWKMNETTLTLNRDVQPECRYNITVFASTSKGNGSRVSRQLTTRPGAPPEMGRRVMISNSRVDDPKRQIAIIVPRDVCNSSNGKVRVWGVVVLRNIDQYQGQYRGQRDDYFRRYLQSQIVINKSVDHCDFRQDNDVIIGDGRCGNDVCNNRLKPASKYRFVVFACTATGCSETRPSVFLETASEEEDSNTHIVAAVAGIVLIALSSLLAAVLYKLWRKRTAVRPSVHFDPATIELGAKKASIVSQSQKSRPVKLHNFSDHVEQLHRDSNLGFAEEFKMVAQVCGRHPTKSAEQQACRTKNRYTNVLPYDHSRVKLLSQDDEEGSDYINANFITGYNCKREYIAAQGPLPSTKDDFWRLIWEQRISMVVMLTQCKEKGRIKCEKYWPDNSEPVYFGDLIVQLRSESVLPDYVIRILDVRQGNKRRVLRHFHFLKWPDFGCPERTCLLLNFVSAVRAHMPHNQEGPTVVHCSAGVGRTGTFIAVDVLLQQIRDYGELDIFGLVLQMRNNRPHMVQTESQYIYIHDCIRDALQEETDDECEMEEEEEEEEEEEPIYQNA